MTTTNDQTNTNGIFYGWVMVAIAFVVQGVSVGVLTYSYSILAVTLNDEFNVSRFQLMLPLVAMTLCGALIGPLLGPKIDKYPIKWFMLAGALMMVIGLWLLSLAPTMPYVVAIYALLMSPVQALFGSLCCSVLISRWFSAKLALAMGLAATGISVGGFLFPPLIEWLSQNYGWREGVRYLSIAVLVAIAPLCMLVCDRPSVKGLFPDGAKAEPDMSAAHDTSVFNSSAALIRSREFWILGITMGILISIYTALLSNLIQLVTESGISRQDGTLLISIISAAGIVGKLGFGAISDRIDLRAGLAATVLLIISGLCFYMLSHQYAGYICGSIVLGLSAGGMLPVWGAFIAKLFGAANYGRVMGLMGLIIVSCNSIAPPLTGFLVDKTGSYTVPFSIYIGILTLTLLWIPMIKATQRTTTGKVQPA